MEIFSLEDILDAYQEFTAKLVSELQFHRDTQAQWSGATSEDEAPSKKIKLSPLKSACRFKWGDYAALSYCWGDMAHPEPIVVNDKVVHVTKNLEAALRALRQMELFQNEYRPWVGALCINQQDLQEKSHQVRMMGEIYRRSWNVIVWLGPEKDFSNEGIDLIRGLAEYWPNHKEIKEALRRDPTLLGVGGAHGLENFGLRPYWRRIWITQELMNGHAETPVLCGLKMIEWENIGKGVEVFLSMERPDEIVTTDRQNMGYPDSGNAFPLVLFTTLPRSQI